MRPIPDFCRRLALASGSAELIANPDRLQEMPWEDFRDWMLWAERNPFGPRHEEWRFATLVQAVVNWSGYAKEPVKLQDISPLFRPEYVERPEPPAERLIEMFKAMWKGRLKIKPRGGK